MIKNWILNLGFVRQAINAASIQGTDFGVEQCKEDLQVLQRTNAVLQDKLKTLPDGNEMNRLVSEKAEDLANEKLQNLLGAVDERTIITMDKKNGLIYVGGERLNEPTILSLKAEAEYFSQSELWKILNETLKDQAQRTMFEKSLTFDDMRSGKMLLYNLSLQNKIIGIFKSYLPKKQ